MTEGKLPEQFPELMAKLHTGWLVQHQTKRIFFYLELVWTKFSNILGNDKAHKLEKSKVLQKE